MKSIGITGGVGAGKSTILDYIEQKYDAYVLKADEVAHILEAKGQPCYNRLVKALGETILDEAGNINKQAFAGLIFNDKKAMDTANSIIHPAVKEYILKAIEYQRSIGKAYFILEAALLIEEGYDKILDEIWYIHSDIEKRRLRLEAQRGYTKEKTDSIVANQLSSEEYMKHSIRVVDNSNTPEETYRQIDEYMM